MTTENFTKAIAALNALTHEELNNLVPYWKQAAKAKRAGVAAVAIVSKGFEHGAILSWVSSKGRTRGTRYYFKFRGMNRAGTAAQGPSCSAEGVVGPLSGTCTVSPQFIDMVNGKSVK
jgi:hypothetical protein